VEQVDGVELSPIEVDFIALCGVLTTSLRVDADKPDQNGAGFAGYMI